MTIGSLLTGVSWAAYLLIFVSVAVRTVRRPTPAHRDMTLFFADTALVIVLESVLDALGLAGSHAGAVASGALILLLPYFLLRLVDDFAVVPRWALPVGVVAALLAIAPLLILASPPAPVTLYQVVYFVALTGIATAIFLRESWNVGGLTRRRMQSVAAGSAFLAADILCSGFSAFDPLHAQAWQAGAQAFGLLSGLAYFAGFAPPYWLRSVWREREVREFLRMAAALPRVGERESVIRGLEAGAARAMGVPAAALGLWDGERDVLRFFAEPPPSARPEQKLPDGRFGDFELRGNAWELPVSSAAPSAVAFRLQRPVFVQDLAAGDASNAGLYASYRAGAALAAPLVSGTERLGVLVVYAARAPLFASSDLELIQMLADQAAVVVKNQALVDESAAMRAREELARLKEDFLSSAAHDLKTPLAGLLSQAQLLARRAARSPDAPADLVGIHRIVAEAQRMRTLVMELLDASRMDQGKLLGSRSRVDLAVLARESCESVSRGSDRCQVSADEPVVGLFDAIRLRQVVDNLLENALKYSQAGQPVILQVRRQGSNAVLTVTDRGIGIPREDLPRVFDRFHRGRNVDDRQHAGLGLGLFICKGIVEEHGGTIVVDSDLGRGSTFVVTLPLSPDPEADDEAPPPRAPMEPARV